MRHIVGAALMVMLTAACGDPEIFDRVAASESASVADAAYPKLADTPAAPPLGVYTAATPDSANGDAALIELALEAESQEARRKTVEGPVE